MSIKTRESNDRHRRGRRMRSVIAMVATIAVGALVAVLVAGWTVATGARTGLVDLQDGSLQVTNLPPLLRTADDHLIELRYDVTCAALETSPDVGCDIAGTVFVRLGTAGSFQAIPLAVDPQSEVGRYVASLPSDVASRPAFSFYATVHDNRTGETVTLPAGGAAAPQTSLLLTRPVMVSLGKHGFGAVDHAAARMASALWGDGPGRVGLENGPQLEPIGASSFDVDSTGTVSVLDEAHHQMLRFGAGHPNSPTAIPLDIRGTIADLRANAGGGVDVLESAAAPGDTPLLHHFDASGRTTGSWHTAERTASALRIGPGGPLALEYPSGEWMPVGTAQTLDSRTATAAQLESASSGQALADGRQIVAEREGSEARIALVDPRGVTASWRIRSATPLAEIRLAEPLGNRIVVVLRAYSDSQDEFVALVLGARGIERQLSIAPDDWAETAPLARFRLLGSSLYHLGSTPSGMFVDRYDLEGH